MSSIPSQSSSPNNPLFDFIQEMLDLHKAIPAPVPSVPVPASVPPVPVPASVPPVPSHTHPADTYRSNKTWEGKEAWEDICTTVFRNSDLNQQVKLWKLCCKAHEYLRSKKANAIGEINAHSLDQIHRIESLETVTTSIRTLPFAEYIAKKVECFFNLFHRSSLVQVITYCVVVPISLHCLCSFNDLTSIPTKPVSFANRAVCQILGNKRSTLIPSTLSDPLLIALFVQEFLNLLIHDKVSIIFVNTLRFTLIFCDKFPLFPISGACLTFDILRSSWTKTFVTCVAKGPMVVKQNQAWDMESLSRWEWECLQPHYNPYPTEPNGSMSEGATILVKEKREVFRKLPRKNYPNSLGLLRNLNPGA